MMGFVIKYANKLSDLCSHAEVSYSIIFLIWTQSFARALDMQTLQWHTCQSRFLTDCPPPAMVDWLLAPGSFIQRLKQHGVLLPRVQVLSQQWQTLCFDERKRLAVAPRQVALVRDVLIGTDKEQLMFARTIFPAKTLTGNEKRLAHLKSRSLGSVLFKNPRVLRSEFELACITPEMDWYQDISQVVKLADEDLWARRSQFFLHQKALLLTEVFLPAMQKKLR
jgi:chorismate--pyruvate lyase